MTHAQIKQNRNSGQLNCEILYLMIKKGYSLEYAAYEIACALRMSEEERESMFTDYAAEQQIRG